MAIIPEYRDPTLLAVDRAIEKAQDTEPRKYLGMSQIGHPCRRALWYSFRHCTPIFHKALSLKRFACGHNGEDLQSKRINMVQGVELHTHQPNGEQFGFSDFGGHFRGHMDGAIHGLIQAPKTWHVWEHKQTDEKKQAKLQKLKNEKGEKNALAEWDEIYYGQAIVYMDYSGMERHYLTCSSPGGRHTISVRTNADKMIAANLKEKAKTIIFAPEPLERLSERPDWFQCNWCDHKSICHHKRVPQMNCRTCAHSTPCRDGGWKCEAHDIMLSFDAQLAGCGDHLFIPALIPYAEMTKADSEKIPKWVEYKHENGTVFWNITNASSAAIHENAYLSLELNHADSTLIGNDLVNELRATFSGRIGETA